MRFIRTRVFSRSSLAVLFAGLMVLALINPASAITIIEPDTVIIEGPDDVDETFLVTYFCGIGETCGTDGGVDVINTSGTVLWGSTSWTINELTTKYAVFTIDISNFSSDGVLMGWSVQVITTNIADQEPFPSSAEIINFADSDTDWIANIELNASGGFSQVDLCTWASNNCTGGGQKNGLGEGETDKVELILYGDFTGITTFYIFPSKWQSVGADGLSLEPTGTVTDCNPCPIPDIPEPATLALFGFGLLALSFLVRRRRRWAEAA